MSICILFPSCKHFSDLLKQIQFEPQIQKVIIIIIISYLTAVHT